MCRSSSEPGCVILGGWLGDRLIAPAGLSRWCEKGSPAEPLGATLFTIAGAYTPDDVLATLSHASVASVSFSTRR